MGRLSKANSRITIESIWEYIDDGFDFEDSTLVNKYVVSQPLGNWSINIFDTQAEVGRIPSIPFDGKVYLQNSTFKSFKSKTLLGKDFRIRGERMCLNRFIHTIELKKDGVEYR